MPDVLGTLRAGRERIARGWCQGGYAKDRHGFSASPDGIRAISWCAVGACDAGDYPRTYPGADELRETLGLNDGGGELSARTAEIVDWNDHPDRTQADVLDLFDRTIARVESEAGA